MTAEVPPLPVGADEGYDFIGRVSRQKAWQVVSAWGEEGWDLGSWPLVVICLYINPLHSLYAVGTYCEGDLDVEQFDSLLGLYEGVDKLAEFYWRHGPNWAMPDLPDEGLLPKHKGPYFGRDKYLELLNA